MTLQLPEDGLIVLGNFLAAEYLLPLIFLYGLLGWFTLRESGSLFQRDHRTERPVWILPGIIVAWLAAEIILEAVTGGAWNRSTLLARDILVLLLGVFLPGLYFVQPRKQLLDWVGRFQPTARFINLGVLGFVGLGLAFWGASYYKPFALKIGTAPEYTTKSLYGVANVVLFIPFLEECLFRALIYPIFRSFLTLWGGIPLVSLLFAGLHGAQSFFMFRFAGSLVISLLFELTGSILPGLVVHAGFNFLLSYGGLLLG